MIHSDSEVFRESRSKNDDERPIGNGCLWRSKICSRPLDGLKVPQVRIGWLMPPCREQQLAPVRQEPFFALPRRANRRKCRMRDTVSFRIDRVQEGQQLRQDPFAQRATVTVESTGPVEAHGQCDRAAAVQRDQKHANTPLHVVQIALANSMVFTGAVPKPIVQIKLEALNAQVRQLQAEFNVLELQQGNQ